jgi:WD40 repeat protein
MKNIKPPKLLLLVLLVPLLMLLSKVALYHFSQKISPDASKEECLKIASEYIQKNKPESAIYPLLLIIQKDKDDTQAHFLLAQAYYQTQVYHLARKECETALVLDAQNRKAFDLLTKIRFEEGKMNWDKGDLEEAISEFIYVLNNALDQKLIDSIANLTGGKYKIKRLTQDLNGENKTCLSSKERDDTSEQFARFSHDDKKIVYEKENQYPDQKDTAFNLDRDIFMKDLDTDEVRRLTNNDTYDGLASFSPDDRRVLFVCGYSGGGSSIFTLNLDTGEKKRVSFKESFMEKIIRKRKRMVLPYCPSFSPDGEKILFHAGYKTRKIFLTDQDGENLKCVAKGQTDDFFPSFSPDGQRIVFVSNQEGQEDLFWVNSDGSNRTRLTYDGGEKKYPSFSPDGNLIVFAAKQKDQDDRYYEIYVLNLKETIPKERLIQRLEEMLKSFS